MSRGLFRLKISVSRNPTCGLHLEGSQI